MHGEFHRALEQRFSVPLLADNNATYDWLQVKMLDTVLPATAAAPGYFAGARV